MATDSSPTGAKQPGRPTKLSTAVLNRLYAALEEGLPQRAACVVAGIGVTTLAEWR